MGLTVLLFEILLKEGKLLQGKRTVQQHASINETLANTYILEGFPAPKTAGIVALQQIHPSLATPRIEDASFQLSNAPIHPLQLLQLYRCRFDKIKPTNSEEYQTVSTQFSAKCRSKIH